ncbi:response regulator [Microbacterium sp. No. 7]|uniref:response regulator n=1 Tax=Microbacterium sp. No. 7 TaxID=1714373 RepID=UPI003FA549C8
MRVLLADDHAMIREGLRLMLESHGIEVVGESADGAAAIAAAGDLRPDVVLMDLRMPGTDGVEATRRIVESGGAEVIALTSFDEDELVLGALRAGAVGFLLKTVDAAGLADAVRRVAAGEGVLDPRVTRRALRAVRHPGSAASAPPAGLNDLTDREREVLRAMGEGLSNAQIAALLFLSVPTVKTHVSNVLAKLGADSRTHAVAMTRDLPPS